MSEKGIRFSSQPYSQHFAEKIMQKSYDRANFKASTELICSL